MSYQMQLYLINPLLSKPISNNCISTSFTNFTTRIRYMMDVTFLKLNIATAAVCALLDEYAVPVKVLRLQRYSTDVPSCVCINCI